jgi:hypothetical protein
MRDFHAAFIGAALFFGLGGLILSACPTSDHPPIGEADPTFCGGCHTSHYDDWQGSMHSYAIRDPVFMAMLKKGIAETNGKLDQFCVQCHAPNASKRDLLPVKEKDGTHVMEIPEDNPMFTRGVQCTTCHSIEKVNATQNANFEFSTTTYFGPTGSEAANEIHPMATSPLFNDPAVEAQLCGSCHDVENPKGARLESTFSEWYSNEFNDPGNPDQHRTCQDCHMPEYKGEIVAGGPEKTLHRHTFVGVDQALVKDYPKKEEQAALVKALLQDCAILEVSDQSASAAGPDEISLRVDVTNINNGHSLPSGSTADRQVWVHLVVRDEGGSVVFESGMMDENGDLMDRIEGHSTNPLGDPDLMLFGQLIFDENNNHVNFPWEAANYTDNLIPPGETLWREYLFEKGELAGQTLTAHATLKYRTFPPFLIQKLIDDGFLDPDELTEIPIVEMEEHEITFNVSN